MEDLFGKNYVFFIGIWILFRDICLTEFDLKYKILILFFFLFNRLTSNVNLSRFVNSVHYLCNENEYDFTMALLYYYFFFFIKIDLYNIIPLYNVFKLYLFNKIGLKSLVLIITFLRINKLIIF